MHLKKTLTPLKLWGLIVGMVISGQYFGWNYGIAQGGISGFIIAFLLVAIFYSTFIFCLAEMSTMLPNSSALGMLV